MPCHNFFVQNIVFGVYNISFCETKLRELFRTNYIGFVHGYILNMCGSLWKGHLQVACLQILLMHALSVIKITRNV